MKKCQLLLFSVGIGGILSFALFFLGLSNGPGSALGRPRRFNMHFYCTALHALYRPVKSSGDRSSGESRLYCTWSTWCSECQADTRVRSARGNARLHGHLPDPAWQLAYRPTESCGPTSTGSERACAFPSDVRGKTGSGLAGACPPGTPCSLLWAVIIVFFGDLKFPCGLAWCCL